MTDWTHQAERAVVGCLILDNSLLADCPLAAADFTSEACAEIYDVISGQVSEGQCADIITVMDELESRGARRYVGTAGEIAKDTVSTGNFHGYLSAIRDASQKRRAKAIGQLLLRTVDQDGVEAVDTAVKDLMALTQERKDWSCDLNAALNGALDVIDQVYSADGELVGVTTGIRSLDDALGGFHDTDLIVIGARPAMGKTALLTGMALSAADDSPVGLISGEQPREQMGLRALSSQTNISAHDLRRARIDEEQWGKLRLAIQKMNGKRLYMNDRSGPHIADVVRQARQWHHRYGITALYVDYLQRIKGAGEKKLEQVSDVTQRLKDLARELDIPVIALAQVKRDVETRHDKRPGLADLSDSSEIEKEADQIITLYRDEVYEPNSTAEGTAELLICKNRHGPTGRIATAWLKDSMRFADLAHEAEEYAA